ncbi:hypothetical protein TanjilG_08406 [Lupinus angustifolius]|uniref:WRKY domain-containing protein n=1 Tax=Lupinus angustifolius TaxID=3871 RepID=A0A1J7INC8_LUPAN|nr:hypothetical protein TanjilG_08406 [Lupinus angustifolius]
MEEFINSIKHAFGLARNLELELPNMSNQPLHILCLSIDDVMKAFNGAKERLLLMMMSQQDRTKTASSFVPMLSTHDATTSMLTSYMDHMFQMQQLSFDHVRALHENKIIGGVDIQKLSYKGTLKIGEKGERDVECYVRSKSEGNVQRIEASSTPRPRKSRKNDSVKKTIMVPAPQVGNTELPPEDGFTWRKYGQKEILGSMYPRGYYRCTHHKLYDCKAKKLIQRVDHNPNIFEVTYRGEHTCHMSSTAPSSYPLLVNISKDMTQSTMSPHLSPSSTSIPSTLRGGGGVTTNSDPFASKYDGDYLVADLADAMFNWGSSNNSIEPLFPNSNEGKWEQTEKKNS